MASVSAKGKRKAVETIAEEPTGKKAKTGTQISDNELGSSRGPTPAALSSTEATTVVKPTEPPTSVDSSEASIGSDKKKGKRKATESPADDSEAKASVRKLAPPRPFPTVPTSVSATGPRSAHVEGKNYICITRKTPLGAYLRRCKDVVLKAGHKTLHLHAMGAAIPHLVQLSVSLPEILPYSADEIHTEVLTGTVELQDEVTPEDEDEDISCRSRGKSTLSITITIGDGKDEGAHTGKGKKKPRNQFSTNMGDRGTRQPRQGGGQKGGGKRHEAAEREMSEQIVFRAEDMDE
ncbi:hypothetical protein PsYK624_040640 [Phanerochaete sordida]|uniref:Uncharacterized protein n=1 Tax=Phanerochaete sordida TaxID=48140 RepID=A0A9P3G481_9APHY|nr:hypothetical protein PsYK624_040640 [Phanerochaete sordida]